MNNPTEQKNKEFLQTASAYLDSTKWEDFLLKWASALEAYGTPRDFVYSTTYKRTEIELSGKRFPAVLITAKNNAKRRELMAQQKPYKLLHEAKEYGLRLSLDDCFLCENIVQEIDAQQDPQIPNNVMYFAGMHNISPNRYPSRFGHSLSVPVEHDDVSARVNPVPDPANKTAIYIPEERKTRGKLMTEEYLRATIAASDSLNLIAFRNHVLDGMSIPGHDHFHLFPEDLPPFSILADIIGEKERMDFGENIYKPQNTPLDTLLICQEERKDLVETAIPILQQLELNNQVFTLNYHKGRLFISPRHQEAVNDRRIQVGSGMPLHYVDGGDESEFVKKIEKYVPLKGQFDWKKYIP
ncbi:MAG: hypothetical protein AABW48_06490 [Nanoarchaeota archaeon]